MWCKVCKCHLASDLTATMGIVAVFSCSVKEGSFGRPSQHIMVSEAPAYVVIPDDGLPVWGGFPPEFGGTEPALRE